MKFTYNDGGRAEAGYKGFTGDCACRAAAIAAQRPYKEVYDLINQLAKSERTGKRKRKVSNARTGVYPDTFKKVMAHYGFVWVPTMHIGQGCTVHLRENELPTGRIVCNLSGHFTAVIDGVINDTYDCSRGGTRCVYGYYINTDAERAANERKQKADYVKRYLVPLLRATSDTIAAAVYTYDKNTHEEYVVLTFKNGYTKRKCVTADSLSAMVVDVMQGL